MSYDRELDEIANRGPFSLHEREMSRPPRAGFDVKGNTWNSPKDIPKPPEPVDPRVQHFDAPFEIWDHIDVAMVRDPRQYSYKEGFFTVDDKGDEYDRIQLGAGFKQITGWRNLEYPMWDCDYYIQAAGYDDTPPEYRCTNLQYGPQWQHPDNNFVDKKKYIQRDESVSEIASYHTLDHLTPQQVVNTLREVERVLIPGGTFTNIVPHADSQLAKECIWHSTRFMIDTWRNIFSERQYAHDGEWNLEVGLNFVFGLAERNTVLVTQLVKKQK